MGFVITFRKLRFTLAVAVDEVERLVIFAEFD
jgi:hypothetical protein